MNWVHYKGSNVPDNHLGAARLSRFPCPVIVEHASIGNDVECC
jgi:hypothetical protein